MKAGERDEFLRAAWRVLVCKRLDLRDFVFVDECGSNTSLAPVYGYSPRGERVFCEVPRNRGPNTTLLASMSAEGMGECLAVQGATTKIIFETYIERILAPSLRPAQVVVMDNRTGTPLSAHKGEKVRELIEERGCELLYLPSYSPDLNPIEEAFSKIKNLLRKAQARTREGLIEALGNAILKVSSQDALGFFMHCGYRRLAQSL